MVRFDRDSGMKNIRRGPVCRQSRSKEIWKVIESNVAMVDYGVRSD